MTTFDPKLDPYASSRETTEGTVFSVTGGDWDSLVSEIGESKEERIIVNMGPQHPSTHGVLRLVLNSKARQLQKYVQVLDISIQVSKRTSNSATGPKQSHSQPVWITWHQSLTRPLTASL
jgi:hypothetical protein